MAGGGGGWLPRPASVQAPNVVRSDSAAEILFAAAEAAAEATMTVLQDDVGGGKAGAAAVAALGDGCGVDFACAVRARERVAGKAEVEAMGGMVACVPEQHQNADEVGWADLAAAATEEQKQADDRWFEAKKQAAIQREIKKRADRMLQEEAAREAGRARARARAVGLSYVDADWYAQPHSVCLAPDATQQRGAGAECPPGAPAGAGAGSGDAEGGWQPWQCSSAATPPHSSAPPQPLPPGTQHQEPAPIQVNIQRSVSIGLRGGGRTPAPIWRGAGPVTVPLYTEGEGEGALAAAGRGVMAAFKGYCANGRCSR